MNLPPPDVSIALGSASVSFCALLISIGQLTIQRRHNRLSVRPFLDSTVTRMNGAPYLWEVTNAGAGPAVITNVELHVGSDTIAFPSLKMIASALASLGIENYTFSSSLGRDSYFVAGQKKLLLELNPAEAKTHQDAATKLSWSIQYRSIYGEKFSHKITTT